MSFTDQLALIGEFASWLGFGLGLPLVLLAWALRLLDGRWEPIEIAIVDAPGGSIARWHAGGEAHSRRLSGDELARIGAESEHPAFVSERRPRRMELEPHAPLPRAIGVAGAVLVALGAVGLGVSLVPLFLP